MPRAPRARPLVLTLACGALACGPGVPTRMILSLERDDDRDDGVRAVEVEVVGALVFLGEPPPVPVPGARCGAQGGLRRAFAAPLRVDLTARGRTPIGAIDLDQAGEVGEVRLLARQVRVHTRTQRRQGHGRMTCVEAGASLAVLRLAPEDRLAVEPERDLAAVAHFHAHGDLESEPCTDHGDDRAPDDDGEDRCHRDEGRAGAGEAPGSRFLLGQHYPLTAER